LRDSMTEEFIRHSDRWVDASRLSDDELAARIQADKIDILIDVSGHTAGNRLAVFARKPAPVAVTAWGNPAGTGSPTTDFVFADPVMIPSEVRHLFPEQIHDLPCAATIDPAPAQRRASEPPCLTRGHVTFGVLNRISKISPDAVRIWSEILRAVPSARLMIKHSALDEAAVRSSIFERFAAQGIAEARIDCIGSTSRDDHLTAYAGVDICLDPFPQNGGISTFEALAMGVPTVCKLGNGLSSRACGAILTSIGLSEWIGDGEAGYIDVAVKAAASPDVLKALRNELPARLEGSATGNPIAYTKAVEDAYRTFWQRYCARAPL
jgi:predicted O-linked N-acetylglucosamine transferase (SPINDLY family)